MRAAISSLRERDRAIAPHGDGVAIPEVAGVEDLRRRGNPGRVAAGDHPRGRVISVSHGGDEAGRGPELLDGATSGVESRKLVSAGAVPEAGEHAADGRAGADLAGSGVPPDPGPRADEHPHL